MNFHSDEWILDKVEKHYEEAVELLGEGRVVGVFYQGSGNYGLDYAGSDVDTKCLVIPTLDELARGDQPTSITHIRENDEHIDLKDVRIMFQVFLKHNINFIEILFTKYYKINPMYEVEVKKLMENKDLIADCARSSIVKSIFGVASEKFHALEHPYPSRMDWISQFGYDPKQLHHLIRLREFMFRYTGDESFGECLTANKPEFHIDVKLGKYNLEEARKYAKESMDTITNYRSGYLVKDNEEACNRVKDLLDDIKCKLIKKGIMFNIIEGTN